MRWFTDGAAHGPIPIRPHFTSVEDTTFQRILAFAHDPSNRDKELMHCLDAAGLCVFETSTGNKAAPITDAMWDAINGGDGARLWHNHPSQDSLSHSDWKCAGVSSKLEVLALNPRGSIFVGRIVDWDDRLHDLLEWLPRLAADLEQHMEHSAKTRQFDFDDLVALSRFTGHVLNLALAENTSVLYTYCLLGDDRAATDRCADVLADGLRYASKAIETHLKTITASLRTSGRPGGGDKLEDRNATPRL